MRVLIVDDNQSLVRGLATFLHQDGHTTATAGTLAEGRQHLDAAAFDLVITDLKLPDGLGLDIVRAARAGEDPAEVILMTAFGTVETAVEAMKLGAMDYLIKPVALEEFAFRIDRLARVRRTQRHARAVERENRDLLAASGLASPLDEMLGDSAAMVALRTTLRKIAPFPSTVLITGETGVGKELAARSIHTLSARSHEPFVRVNCASIPDTLFESELFGHEKGAFTDARERRIGRFEAAQGGTLFLDEVGEVPLALQAKLLRAIQDKEIHRVGGTAPLIIDTRIVAATNRDLDQMVTAGTFRQDLLYRLAVIRVPVPSLRERRQDLPMLANHLLHRIKGEFGRPRLALSAAAVAAIAAARWPGNVRQLRNVIERAVVLCEGDIIGPEVLAIDTGLPTTPATAAHPPDPVDVSCSVNNGSSPAAPALPGDQRSGLVDLLAGYEKQLIEAALARARGVKSRAAEELRLPRTNLLYRMKRLGLDADSGDTE